MFEIIVLRRIFGLKRDEVMGRSNTPLSEELRDLYSLPSTSRIIKSKGIRWAGHVKRMRIETLMGYWLEGQWGNRQLDRQRPRWDDKIKMDLGSIRWDGVD
jgi:hypothetical protein